MSPPLSWSVACGLIFVAWNRWGFAGCRPSGGAPGLGGLVAGSVWLLGGTLGGYIITSWIRICRAGSATVSMGLGSQWAVETLWLRPCTGHRC